MARKCSPMSETEFHQKEKNFYDNNRFCFRTSENTILQLPIGFAEDGRPSYTMGKLSTYLMVDDKNFSKSDQYNVVAKTIDALYSFSIILRKTIGIVRESGSKNVDGNLKNPKMALVALPGDPFWKRISDCCHGPMR